MAVCKQCGTQISDQDIFCPSCGAKQENENQHINQPQYSNSQTYYPQNTEAEDKGGFLWGLLGCCIPIVGLVLFLVWKDNKPKTAKAAGMGALISVIIAIVYYIIIVAVGVGTAAFSFL